MKRPGDLRFGGRGTPVSFSYDGQEVAAYEGETVAMALWAAGVHALRTSPRRGEPRGVFCAMGVCQECVVLVDGRRQEGCTTRVRAGLEVHPVPPESGGR